MPHSAETWRRIFELYDRAVDLPADQRNAWLVDATRTDGPEILAAVRTLLARPEQADESFALRAAASVRAELEAIVDAGDPSGEARLGAWRLIREVGRGGMGVVYLAERADGAFEQRAAVKRIRRGLDTDEVLARFLRERQILARLRHPNIAGLIDGGADDAGRPYFVMEYVEGEPVTAWCDRCALDVEARLRLFLTACRAVEFAHRNLVVHRDLKPSNIIVTTEGAVKLLDFGIAKVLSGDADQAIDHTRSPMAAMTPAYAAPEQIRGEPATTATDVHGLGGVLYELLTGRRAYDIPDASPLTYARAILEQDPPAPSAAAPPHAARRLRGDLDAVVLTALARAPEARYGSVGALCADLERHLAGLPVQARRAPWSLRMRKFLARHRIGVAATALVLVAAVAGVAATLWQANAAARAARRAGAVTAFLTSIFQESDPSAARGTTVTARELLDRGAARVDRELADQPEVQAEMFRVIGELYRQLGLLDDARPLLDKAVTLAASVHGPDSAESGAALDRWGVLLWDRGAYQEAAIALERALALRRRAHGAGSAEVSSTMGALASVYSDLGRDEQAEALHRQAYDIDRALHGQDSLEAAASAANLAIKLEERRAFDEAETLHRQALDIRRRIGGPDHPDVADSLLALGVLQSKRGREEEAERLDREALEIATRVLGPAHPKVAHILDNLSTVVEHRGRLADAVAIAREALEVRRRTLPPGHPDLGLTINNFAVTSFRLGSFADAERGFREAMDIFARTLGPEHNYTSTALNNIALVLRERGSLAEAETLARRALAVRRATRGDDSPEVAQSQRNLGLILMDRRAFAEAERTLADAVARSRRVYPAGHLRLAETLVALAQLNLARNAPAAAEPLLREALEIRLPKSGDHSWQTAEARLYLGSALCARGDAEALPLIDAAETALSKMPEQPRWRLAEARAVKGACLSARGRQAEGRRLIADSLKQVEAELGPRHHLTEAIRRLPGGAGNPSR